MTTHAELAAEVKLRRVTTLSLRDQRRLHKLTLLVSDSLMLALAFTVSYALRFASELPLFRADVAGNPAFYRDVGVQVVPLWLLFFWLAGLYNEHNLLGGTREYSIIFNSVSAGMLVVVMVTFLNPAFVVARGWLLVSWFVAFLFVAIARFGLRRAVYLLRRRGWFLSPALIVGVNEEAQALAEQLATWQSSGLNVLGYVSSQPEGGRRAPSHLSVLGDVGDLAGLVDRLGVEEVIIATSCLSRKQLVDVFREFATHERAQLRLSSGLFEVMTTGLEIKELAYVPLINMRPVRLSGIDTVLKLLLDYGLAIPVAVLGSPVFLLLALLVKLDSPGPIIHRRRVLGLGGREYDALKFRSMRLDGHEIIDQHPELKEQLADNHKLKDDPRVTRVGKYLRKYSLDELPQVFNVLLGQMSIVGPRMISPAEQCKYGQWDMNLLTVKPGITGLWQVSGRSDVSYEDRVRLDMNYIRNWTIWLDLQILIQTIPAVIKARGAY